MEWEFSKKVINKFIAQFECFHRIMYVLQNFSETTQYLVINQLSFTGGIFSFRQCILSKYLLNRLIFRKCFWCSVLYWLEREFPAVSGS